ncbi:hypothetical protein BDY24DRAFT_399513 [Mrakia frigida]|uniref:uncharacterized protein n=1 Tax=Mrakia frigida TaxID=29902 RepID=UPI003FCBF641
MFRLLLSTVLRCLWIQRISPPSSLYLATPQILLLPPRNKQLPLLHRVPNSMRSLGRRTHPFPLVSTNLPPPRPDYHSSRPPWLVSSYAHARRSTGQEPSSSESETGGSEVVRAVEEEDAGAGGKICLGGGAEVVRVEREVLGGGEEEAELDERQEREDRAASFVKVMGSWFHGKLRYHSSFRLNLWTTRLPLRRSALDMLLRLNFGL